MPVFAPRATIATMIYVALGGNLPTTEFGAPRETLEAAIGALTRAGLTIRARSPWYESAPVPPSDQPLFVNGVLAVEADLSAPELLGLLHMIEADFGRVRREQNAARPLDLDLIDYRGEISSGRGGGPVLPHPRMEGRSFVLLPLRDIAPQWRHPVSGKSIEALVKGLTSTTEIRQLEA